MRRLYPDQPLVGVGAIIICHGKILLQKRERAPDEGKWSIPGGLVELGENLGRAVIREVKEETGLKVEKPELIDVVENIIPDEKGKIKYHYIIVDFFVELADERFEALEDAGELRWVELDKAEDYDLPEILRRFFRKNMQKLEKRNSCR